ncbi:MAG: transcriptional regulator [Acidimicrobiales bacterium]
MASEEGADTYGVELGTRLRAVRKQKGLSLQAVEEVSGHEFKASVLGAYERGQRRIAVPRLKRLAELYRVPLEQLLSRHGEDHPASPDRDHPDGEPARIDLTKLAKATGPEKELLERYLASIEVQRQDFNGRVITIRRDDLRVIASLFERSPAEMLARLAELDLLAGRH